MSWVPDNQYKENMSHKSGKVETWWFWVIIEDVKVEIVYLLGYTELLSNKAMPKSQKLKQGFIFYYYYISIKSWVLCFLSSYSKIKTNRAATRGKKCESCAGS